MQVFFTCESNAYPRIYVYSLVSRFVDIFLGAVRVGAIDDEIVINPTRLEQQHSALNLVLSGCAKKKVGTY